MNAIVGTARQHVCLCHRTGCMATVYTLEKRTVRHQGSVNHQIRIFDGYAALHLRLGGRVVDKNFSDSSRQAGNPRTMHTVRERVVSAFVCGRIDGNIACCRVCHACGYVELVKFNKLLLLSFLLTIHGYGNYPRVCSTLNHAHGGQG